MSVGHYSRAFFDDEPSFLAHYHCRQHLALLWRNHERAKLMQKSTEGSVGEPDREPVSDRQRTILVGSQERFFGQASRRPRLMGPCGEAPTDRGKIVVPASRGRLLYLHSECGIRFPLSQPITSKYLLASNCARCSGDNHSRKRFTPRASRVAKRVGNARARLGLHGYIEPVKHQYAATRSIETARTLRGQSAADEPRKE